MSPSAEPLNSHAFSAPYVKFMRSEATDMLLKYPGSFTLLALIAYRARREVPAFNPYAIEVGEAMIGDPAAVGLSRQQFRTALANLQKWGLITIRTTNKGTIVKLSNKSVYDINAPVDQPATQPGINHQPNQTSTTNKNERRKEENSAAKAAIPAPSFLESSELASTPTVSPVKTASRKTLKIGATADEIAALSLPHSGAEFRELWVTFYTSNTKQRGKPVSAFMLMLKILGKYPEGFAMTMLELAIQGDWVGVKNDGTDRAYEQWQAQQARHSSTPDTGTAPATFDPAELFGLDSSITHAQALAHNCTTPEYAAYRARQQVNQSLT